MSDRIALLVGRVILAWGELDQHIYRMLMTFQAGKPRTEFEPRFKHRLKLIRRHVVEITRGDAAILADFDRTNMTLINLERRRAHLAHGMLGIEEDGVLVFDHREGEPYLAALTRLIARQASADEIDTLWFEYNRRKYTWKELDELATDIRSAKDRLGDIRYRATILSRELKNQPPPQE